MKRLLTCILFGGLLAASIEVASPVRAMPLREVISTIQNSGGYYSYASASLRAADCSGLVSVAQSLAMGTPIRRLGDTHTLLAGQWPDAIPGATQGDSFIIGANSGHMVAQILGVNIEASTSGRPFLVGPQAASPWEPRFTARYHINPAVLVID